MKNLLAKRYQVLEIISAGSFSIVFKVLDTQDNTLYALKKMENPEAIYIIENEIAVLKKINLNNNFLKFYGEVRDGEDLYLKFELSTGKNLKKIIEDNSLFDEKEAMKLLSDIVKQLHFTHQSNIIHNNIKPQNILMHEGHYYLIDWGVSLEGQVESYENVLTDEMFLTPEHYNAKVCFNSDIYSLAHVVYYVLHGHLLYGIFSQMSSIQVMLFHLTKKVTYKESLSDAMKNLLDAMLCKEHQKRADVNSVYGFLFHKQALKCVKCNFIQTPTYELNTNKKILEFLKDKNVLMAEFLYAVHLEDNKQYKEAIALYLDLAKRAYTRAMNNLGHLYEADTGVKQNYKFSAYWYFQSGKLGNAMAIHNMAKIFKYAKGVEQNNEKAQRLFELARKKGFTKK